MKILQVNKLYFPSIGGIETVTKDFAEYFNGRDDIEVNNLVCRLSGERCAENINGVTTHRAATWSVKFGMPISLDFFFLFAKLIQTADVVLLHHPFPLAFVAYWLFGRGKRLVIWYHSDILRQKFLKIPFEPFLRFGLRKADCILVSNHTIIKESPALRLYADKCRVAYFGVNLERFEPTVEVRQQADAIRSRLGGPLILSVGRLVPYKGFCYLIEAMKSVAAKLLIIGGGPLESALRGQIVESGLADKVRIEPSVPDLAPYYHACDVFALASCQNTEVFGIVQIEALACGKPVINTALSTGVPEVSLHQYSGYTVPPGDPHAFANALQAIFSDPTEYARMSDNARIAAATRFTTDAMFASVQTALAPTFAAVAKTETVKQVLSLRPQKV